MCAAPGTRAEARRGAAPRWWRGRRPGSHRAAAGLHRPDPGRRGRSRAGRRTRPIRNCRFCSRYCWKTRSLAPCWPATIRKDLLNGRLRPGPLQLRLQLPDEAPARGGRHAPHQARCRWRRDPHERGLRSAHRARTDASWRREAAPGVLTSHWPPRPDVNTSNLRIADFARKNREIRGAWHHAGGGPGASVQGVGWPDRGRLPLLLGHPCLQPAEARPPAQQGARLGLAHPIHLRQNGRRALVGAVKGPAPAPQPQPRRRGLQPRDIAFAPLLPRSSLVASAAGIPSASPIAAGVVMSRSSSSRKIASASG